MATVVYAVEGVVCESCLAAVLENVHSLSGVSAAAMDLVASGQSPLIVTSSMKLGDDAVRHAIERAGFGVSPPSHRRLRDAWSDVVTWGGDANPGRERMMFSIGGLST